MYLPEDVNDILNNFTEGEVLEFKKAENEFDSRDRSDYCAAIANMGGGKLLLGVSNDRHVVGTNIYSGTINKIPQQVYQAIGITVRVEEIKHPDGRVVIFDITSRPVGQRVRSNGHYTYPIRRGESLGEMDDEMTREILNEIQPDFSSGIMENATIEDLDDNAVENFKKRRAEKTGNPGLATAPTATALADTGLLRGGKLTFACLLLLGKKEKISDLLQAEIIYEWRSDPMQIHHDFRKTWRAPYFSIYDEVWKAINDRNIRFPYQEGFIQQEVWAFYKEACREAVNNAVAHRDYTIAGRSIIINASPESFSVISPGAFLIILRPRTCLFHSLAQSVNSRAFERTNLVERSGPKGMDNIFEASIRQGKGLPNFDGTDAIRSE